MAEQPETVNYRAEAEKIAGYFKNTFMTKDQQLLHAILMAVLSQETTVRHEFAPGLIGGGTEIPQSKSQARRFAAMEEAE